LKIDAPMVLLSGRSSNFLLLPASLDQPSSPVILKALAFFPTGLL